MATETINGQKYYTGSLHIKWDLDWNGYLQFYPEFDIYVRIPDTLEHIECWIANDRFDINPHSSGSGFYNVGGIMWEHGPQGPIRCHSVTQSGVSSDTSAQALQDMSPSQTGTSRESGDNTEIDGYPNDIIYGFICRDSTGVVSDLADSASYITYNRGTQDNPVIINLETPGVIPIEQLLVRGFSRWLNDPEDPNYISGYPYWSYVGTTAAGLIYLEDLFPDYYPWAILKDNTWASANRAGGNHKMIQNSAWRDDKNNFLLQKNQTVYQLKSDGWLRCDEIGAE